MWNLLLDAVSSLNTSADSAASSGASSALENYNWHPSFGEVALDALLGFVVVFLGIAFLVFMIWVVNNIVHKISGKPAEKKAKEPARASETAEKKAASAAVGAEDLTEETVAVITAAIMAYYAKEKPGCGFTVKRIRKI